MATVIGAVIVFAVVGLIVIQIVRNKVRHRGASCSCGCDCTSCGGCCSDKK